VAQSDGFSSCTVNVITAVVHDEVVHCSVFSKTVFDIIKVTLYS